MAVSLTLLTLHVVLFLLTDAITHRSRHPHASPRRSHGSVPFNPTRRSEDTQGLHLQQGQRLLTRGSDPTVRHFVTDRGNVGDWRDSARREDVALSPRKSKHNPSTFGSLFGRGAPKSATESQRDTAGDWRDTARRKQQILRKFESEDVRREDTSSICGDGWCTCADGFADCSKHYGALKFIPKLPAGITGVDFSFNELKSIDSDFFLSNVTNITTLYLYNNRLTAIAPGAFQHMSSLKELYLANNEKLTYDVLGPVSAVRSLETLDLSGNNLGDPPVDAFVKFSMSQLTSLYLINTSIKLFNCSVLAPLRNLSTLILRKNHGMSVIYDYLPSLKVLILSSISAETFPTFCTDHNAPFYPNLSDLYLSFNFISALPPQVCLPRLTNLDLSGNPFVQITTDMFNQSLFPLLSTLALDYTPLQRISSNAFRSPSLSTLTVVTFNNLDFGSDAVSADAFAGCPRLFYLNLGSSDLSGVSDDKFQRLFGHLTNLETVIFSNTSLSGVASLKTLAQSPVQFLNLDGNVFTRIPDGVFDNVTSLLQLYFSNNNISMVTETTFSPATRERLQELDLSGNPFNCSDDLTWFCQWMQSDPDLFQYSVTTYMCYNKPGVPVTSLCPGKAAVDLSGQGRRLTTSHQRSLPHVLDLPSDQRSSAHVLDPSPNPRSSAHNLVLSSNQNPSANVIDVDTALGVGAGLLIALIGLTVAVTVCCTRHILIRHEPSSDKQRLLKG